MRSRSSYHSLCQIGHIAIQIGRMLEWDPELEKFNDEEANTLLTREMRTVGILKLGYKS